VKIEVSSGEAGGVELAVGAERGDGRARGGRKPCSWVLEEVGVGPEGVEGD